MGGSVTSEQIPFMANFMHKITKISYSNGFWQNESNLVALFCQKLLPKLDQTTC
jgi:hypothetical protein